MIELRGFGWRHAGRRDWAVRGVDLKIEPGERVLLLGRSGAGKSTLLHAMAGLLPEDTGESEGAVTVDGGVGIVFQDPQSQLVMTRAGDEVAFGLENLGWPAARIWPRVDAVLTRVGFPYGRDRHTSALSGGEQQRLVLAGALAPSPGLLLLDEPTANLDPAGADLVCASLRDVETFVLIEHRIEKVLNLVNRVVVLEPGGGVRLDGPPSLLSTLDDDELWLPNAPLPVFPAGVRGDRLLWTPDTASSGALGWTAGSAADHSLHGGATSSAYHGGTGSATDDGPQGRATSSTSRGRGKTAAVQGDPRLLMPGLAVHAGAALAITGPNGSGKTTLALKLGGLRPGGVSSIWGDPYKLRPRQLAGHIGSVFQNPEHQFIAGRVSIEVPDPAMLERLHLSHLADANPFTLSGGEARRLSVATALAAKPRVLILDEPTFGQDRRTWTELIAMLAELRDTGHGIVVVTHDPHVVSSLDAEELVLQGIPR